jgi:tRNA dimethylallyltransferase
MHEREGIPHHLIDFIGLEEESWRIGQFKKECLRAIQDIHSRGKIPVLVGGTSYYVQSVLFNDALVGEGAEDVLSDDKQPERQKSTKRTSEEWAILDAPVETMMEKLRDVDPIMANRWHINEGRKIRRSLEIYLETGRRASEIYEEQMHQRQAAIEHAEGIRAGQLRFPTLVFWVHAERENLYRRLENRVDTMAEQGLIAEAQSLSEYAIEQEAQGNPIDLSRGIWVSIGYKEMEPYFTALRAGNLSEKELETLKESCLESVKTSTRQYSTRQVQWIRRKLWTALADIGANNQLYVLDTTDPGDWDTSVAEPMERIVQAFLRNEDLPEPKTLSQLAEEALTEREHNYTKAAIPPAQILKQMTCELCNRTMMGQEQWNIHMRASSHRRALKAAEKKARNMEWLRNHPPAEAVDGQPA